MFNIVVNNKLHTHEELHEFFIYSLRKTIRQHIDMQFSQYNLSVLNTLLYRFKDIYPEDNSTNIPVAHVMQIN